MRSLLSHLNAKVSVPVLAGALVAGLAVAATAPAQAESPAGASEASTMEETLLRYAEDTWASFVAMTDEDSGLPADRLHAGGDVSVQTSTTNIGSYMWSAVVAEELGIIGRDELVSRLSTTLDTLEGMERHDESGQYFNWYDHRTGEKLTAWPPSGRPLVPHLSSVDNGWLATAFQVVSRSVPEVSERAGALFDSMDFSLFYDADQNALRRTYVPDTGEFPCCYNMLGETRIATWLGVAKGEMPQRAYYGAWRAQPATCQFSGQEQLPAGDDRLYFGETVFEGTYEYAGMRVSPNWGGSMFEGLMVPLFFPEDEWGAGSWRVNHPVYVRSHIHHGLEEAQYGYWGFSPADVPEGGYRTYGVDAIGTNPGGSASNNDNTLVDFGFDLDGCARDPQPQPGPEEYTNGVVTPHAAFLGLRWAPEEAVENLVNLERDFDIYTEWGFRDSVNVDTGTVAEWYLSLDQGMIMAAIGNHLADDVLREAFKTPEFERNLRPPMAVEEFPADPRDCTITGTPEDDVIVGTSGEDVICALGGDDVIRAGGGHDIVYGDAGDDVTQDGDGDDVVYGGPGHDRIVAGAGDDILSAGPGDDVLTGGRGTNHFEGGAGSNTCAAVSAGETANACHRGPQAASSLTTAE